MLVLCITFALITFGFVLPCVIDVITTPRHLFDQPSKQLWLIVTVGFWAFGATVWLLVGRREVQMRKLWDDVTQSWIAGGPDPRHPAGRPAGADYPFRSARRGRQATTTTARFVAPDDNPAFLLELERRIQGWHDGTQH
jgi:hypothetical protein